VLSWALARLRRVEFSHPEVNRNLRTLMLRTGKHYDAGVMQRLDVRSSAP